LANGGTIFLDDVDDIPFDIQVKLLRVLQEKEFNRVGSAEVIKTDARVIASTKRDLYRLVKEGKFRQDLYYRLNVFPLHVPPLRERQQDIPELLNYFLREFRPENPPEIDYETMAILMEHPWEGNVRELRNLAERFTLVCDCDPVAAKCLPHDLLTGQERPFQTLATGSIEGSLDDAVQRYESDIIKEALRKSEGNKAKAAQQLGIPVSTLKSKLKKYS
jgi:two-component system response regulator AtoC